MSLQRIKNMKCKLNGEEYTLDYKGCKTTGKGKNKKYFPGIIRIVKVVK